MKKVYIKPLVEFTEMENEDLLNYPLSKATTKNYTSDSKTETIYGPETIIDNGDGGKTGTGGFVNSKGGFFDDDIMSDWDF